MTKANSTFLAVGAAGKFAGLVVPDLAKRGCKSPRVVHAIQRWMLRAAIERGANILKAFSNAPPYWMTLSGCGSGGSNPNHDHLDPKAEDVFVGYLVEVVAYFQSHWGVRFRSLDPFNEPLHGPVEDGPARALPVRTRDTGTYHKQDFGERLCLAATERSPSD